MPENWRNQTESGSR